MYVINSNNTKSEMDLCLVLQVCSGQVCRMYADIDRSGRGDE